MKIDSVISSIQVSQNNRQAVPATAATVQKVAETVSLEKADQATQIMKKYDLHNISHPEIGSMIMELYKAGVIPEDHLLDFTEPSWQNDELWFATTGKVVKSNPNEKIDYIARVDLMLAAAERDQMSESSVNYARKFANFFHNLDALNAQA
ncbi:MAG: hypothetical protein HYZ65_01480 [Burkholderiales bacterium]|nr:hypothetical protein [Burkholderiales bacterium]